MATASLDSLTAAPETAPALCCPRCQSALDRLPDAFRCRPCARSYPIVLGIPDLRVEPDPWISFAEEREKAERLAARIAGASFEEAVRAYWALTPDTPTERVEHFVQHVMTAQQRSADWLASIAEADVRAPSGPWLEVGCGTGDLLAAAARRAVQVIGTDIALRWLVVARTRFPAGREPLLICCNGEHLPFEGGRIAGVFCVGTLEHCRRPARVIEEAHRVLAPGGVMRARSVNRYSLLREPHVGVWGVGFVPRRWADGYVRWRSGQRYLHHRPLSRGELARGLRRAGFRNVRVTPASLVESDRSRLGRGMRICAPAYGVLRRVPVVRSALASIGPMLEAHALR